MSKRQTKASTSKREKKANGLVKNMTSLLNHIAWPEVERKMKVHHANYFSGELELMLNEVEEERKNFKALLREVAGNDKVPGTPKRNKPGILAKQIMENYKQIVLNFDEDDESTLNASAMTEQSEAQTEQTASKSHFSTIPSTTMHSTDVSDMTLRENTNAMSMSNVDDTPKPTAASTPCNENAVVKKKPATKPKYDETTPLKREKSKRQVRQKHCEDKVDQAAKQREEIIKDKAERARRDREERQRRVDQNNKLQDQLRHEKEEAVRQQLDRVKKYEEEQRDKNQLLSPRSNMPGPSGCSKPTNMGASSRTAPSRIPKPAAAFFSPGKVAVPPKKNKTPSTVAVDLKSPALPPRDDSKRKRPVGTKKAEEEEKKLQVQMEAAREKEEADRKKKEMALQKQREEEERQRKLQEELERQEEEEVAEAEKSLATLKLEPADEAGDHADDDDEVVPDSLLMQASDEKTEEVKENKAPDGEEAGNKSSYDMTIEKVFLPSTDENYNVDDLSSNDETDDEERPRKIVPKWAQKSSLRERVMYLRDVLPEENRERYFGRIPAPNVEMFFPNSIKKYKPRSSSAHWNSPLAQPSRGISRYNEVRK